MSKKQTVENSRSVYKILVDEKSDLYKQCMTDIGQIKSKRISEVETADEWYIDKCFEDIFKSLKSIDGSLELDSHRMSSPADCFTFQIGDYGHIAAQKAINDSDDRPVLILVYDGPVAKDKSQPAYIDSIIKNYKAELMPTSVKRN